MPIVPLRGFGKYGVIADSQDQALPMGTWSDARNVRFSGLSFEKMLEPSLEMAAPTQIGGQASVTAKWLQGWSDGLSTYFVVAVAADDGFDYLLFWKASNGGSGQWLQAGGPYQSAPWQSFEWGDTVIFNNGTGAPQIFNQSALQFEDLPKWGYISTADDILNAAEPSSDTGAVCKCLFPYKSFLVALGVSERGQYQPNTVWWSDSTPLVGLNAGVNGTGGPPDWDYESPASLSGKSEVGVGDGALTWAEVLNENLICYTDASATAMQAVGGRQVMSFRRLFNKGCAGLHLSAEFNNQHFVIARDQIYVHDGSTVRLIAKDRIEEEFFTRAGKGGRFGNGDIDFTSMQIVKNPDRKELMVLYDGYVIEELFGELDVPSGLELVETAIVDHNTVADYRDSWGNNGYIHSDGKGTVLASLDGGWSDFSIPEEEGYVYRSDDFGQTWSEIDARTVFPVADDSGEGRIWSFAYDPTISRWWVRNYSTGTQVQYSDDGGHTFYNVKDPTANLALGLINLSSFGVNYVEGSTTTVMIAGYSNRADISQYYRAAGYWVDTGDTWWEQQYGRSALNSPSNNYQLMNYQGRHLSGLTSGSDWHLFEVTDFENGVSEPISYGAFPGTHQWASKGDGIILAATGDTIGQSYIEYQRADVRDANNVTITTHQIETEFDYIGGVASEIYCNDDYFIAYAIRTSDVDGRYGTVDMALFISEDGANWGDQITLTLPVAPQYDNITQTTLKATYAGAGAWLFTYAGTDNRHRIVRLFINSPGVTYRRTGRFGLVYNFEDDNYTWMDAAVDKTTSLENVVCATYAFDPGWQVRWSDLANDGATWDGSEGSLIVNGVTRWSDFYRHGTEKNMYWLTTAGVYRADQVVKKDGLKEYFVERINIDLDDLNPQWTTNMWKHLRQFYFHMQSPTPIDGLNNFDLTVGWAKTLMDTPEWDTPVTVNLQDTGNNGEYKADIRTTGRYLSLRMDFNSTDRFKMSGGDMDAIESHGR